MEVKTSAGPDEIPPVVIKKSEPGPTPVLCKYGKILYCLSSRKVMEKAIDIHLTKYLEQSN